MMFINRHPIIGREENMKDSLNLILLLLFHSSVAQKCGDFTIGSCQNDDLIWDNEVHMMEKILV